MTAVEGRGRTLPLQPPYLVTTVTNRRGVSVGVTADASSTVVEMKVHGPWSQHLGNQVTSGLRLCLAGPSEALIIDLHDVADPHGTSLPFWLAAQRTARDGPSPVHLALCVPPSAMLGHRLRHHDGNPPLLFATMTEARIAIGGRLARNHRWQTRLAPHPTSVPVARELVKQACEAWQLLDLRHDAVLIMSELSSNAVEHAGTEFVITVSRRGSDLHLAVRDSDTRYPHLDESAPGGPQLPLSERGRGLRLVHATAAGWGAMPAHGGKVVWATLSGDPGG
ncbi:ATP-binding protein [Actinoplanes sp. NPDC023936]|uniref:ATP-binding protein n=1 Tax=Actinoplanes sp. NPDC023936 TaxID=3154910 RepID=UPI00340198D2